MVEDTNSASNETASQALDLYRIMVETVTANEQRRQLISSVFLTLLAAGFGASGTIENFNFAFASAPALVISFVWFSQVRHLKRLAKAKFYVIGQLEEKMSFRPFEEEWNYLSHNKAKRSLFGLGLADIEMITPLCVFGASLVHLVWLAWGSFA